MNGNFEAGGIYPFSTSPAAGWGHANPSGEYIVTYVPLPGKAAKIDENSPRDCVLVDEAEATRFPDAIAATRAAAVLTGK